MDILVTILLCLGLAVAGIFALGFAVGRRRGRVPSLPSVDGAGSDGRPVGTPPVVPLSTPGDACPSCGYRNRPNWTVCGACLRPRPVVPASPPSAGTVDAADHVRWFLDELDGAALGGLLDDRTREQLRAHYRALPVSPVPAAAPSAPMLEPGWEATPETVAPASVPPVRSTEPSVAPGIPRAADPMAADSAAWQTDAPLSAGQLASGQLASGAATADPPMVPPIDTGAAVGMEDDAVTPAALPEGGAIPSPSPPLPAVPRPRPWERWDSAVVLLYLGAFLVVAAGLVYSSYNWAALGGWGKVGLLAAATFAFSGGGWALLPVARVRAAAETFVAVGAFLVPMNVLAVRNLVAGGDEPGLPPAVTYELGAVMVATLYGCFSYRPGGVVYRYGTAAAVLLAVAALPPALGAGAEWGGALVALAAAPAMDLPRRLRGGARRFARPAVRTVLVALPVAVAASAAPFVRGEGSAWALPVALGGATLTLARLATRRDSARLAAVAVAGSAFTVIAALAAGERPAADWTIVADGLAVAWLLLAGRGPRLARRSPTRDVLHFAALALFAAAPVGAIFDGQWVLASLAWVAGTVGAAGLAWRRRTPALGAVAAVLATLALVALGPELPDRLLDAPRPIPLLPAPLGLAAGAWAIGRRLGGRRGRVWSWPVWAVAGIEAGAVTVVAAARAAAGFERRDDEFVLLAVALPLAAGAFVAARALRSSAALLATAGWLELAVVSLVVGVPTYRGAPADATRSPSLDWLSVAALRWDVAHAWPALVVLNLALAALMIVAPLPRSRAWDGQAARRRAAGLPGGAAGIAAGGALLVTAAYVIDLRRPPLLTAYPETGWWWPYLAFWVSLAATAVAVGRRLDRSEVAPPTVGVVGVGALLGLRMAYAAVDAEALRWPPVLVTLGLTGGLAALSWSPRRRFDRALRLGLARLGGAAGLAALGAMLLATAAYALDLDRLGSLSVHPEAGWWWPYLAVYVAIAGGGWVFGTRLASPTWSHRLAVLIAVAVVAAEVLALRMTSAGFRPDERYWVVIVAAVGVLTCAVALALAQAGAVRHAPFDAALGRALGAGGVLLGGPAVLGALVLTAAYAVDLAPPFGAHHGRPASWWWPFLGLYLGTAALGLALGPRARRPLPDLAPVASGALGAGLVLGLRMAYAGLPLDRWSWLPILVVVGGMVAAAGLWRRDGRLVLAPWTSRGPADTAFGARVGKQVAGVGATLAVVGQLGAAGLTVLFVLALRRPDAVPRGDDPQWWWRLLLLHALIAAGMVAAGRRFPALARVGALAPVAVGIGALATLLALRMATTDLAIWTYLGGAVGGLAYLRWASRRPRGQTPFDRELRRWLDRLGVGAATAALAGNLWLASVGQTAPFAQALAYAAVAVGALWAGLRDRRPRLGYPAAAAMTLALGFGGVAAGLGAVDTAVLFAAFSWVLIGGALTLPRRGRWVGQAVVWERAAYAVAALPVGFGLTATGALDPGAPAYQRLVLAVLSLAGILAVVAAARRRALQGYAASALALTAGLLQTAVAEPANVQAYTAPVALYLLAVAWTRRDREPRVFDALVGAGAALLLVPPFAQSLAADGYGWALLCGAEALALVFAGLIAGRRTPVAAGVIGLTAVVLRQTVDYANALPTWATMLAVGMLLLAVGTLSLVARDAVRGRAREARARWRGMR